MVEREAKKSSEVVFVLGNHRVHIREKDKKTTKTTKTLQYFFVARCAERKRGDVSGRTDSRVEKNDRWVNNCSARGAKFSGGDAFFQEAFREYERVEKVKTARVSW